MVLLCKQKALYVKCCIIPNGVTDSQGDTLYSEDIKKIFTSFNNQDNFEVYHNDIPIQEVTLLENYISTANETIGTAVVPSGSWNAVIRVDNPDIQNGLLTGEFGGVSLNNRIADKCRANLTGQVRYKDIPDAECVIPLLISFVESGANGYGLHVMDYDAYIQKSNTRKNGANKMAFDLLGGLKSLVKQAEEESSEPVILKEDKTPEEEEEPVTQKEDDVTEEEVEEEPTVEKADEETETEEEEEDEAEITKEDDSDLEARVAALEEQVAELLKEKETTEEVTEENPDPTEEPVDEDTPKITKSEKVVITTQNEATNKNYYEITGRDPVTGLKL